MKMTNSEISQQSETTDIDEIFQQAISHHKSLRFNEAEDLYRVILVIDPQHPDANHNMGMLRVQQKRPAEGLPYFKTALDVNPTRRPYWLNYIDALHQDGQNETAVNLLALCREHGLDGEEVDTLASRINGGGSLTVPSNVFPKSAKLTRSITFKNYCVSHEQPLLPDRLYDFIIGLGDYFPEKGINISKLDSFWDENRPLAYGAAGSYNLPNAIKINGELTDITGVSSHRKIVARTPIGREANNYPGLRLVSTVELSFLTVEDIKPNEGYEFLISRPLQCIQSIFTQYNSVHHITDLLEYLSIAVQLGILSSAEVNEFIAERILFPGGCEMGVFPTIWLTEILSKLESVGREFILRAGNRIRQYDSYQVRAVGFLSERLGSFFLHKELMKRYPAGIPNQIFGFMCNVQNGNEYIGTQIKTPGFSS